MCFERFLVNFTHILIKIKGVILNPRILGDLKFERIEKNHKKITHKIS